MKKDTIKATKTLARLEEEKIQSLTLKMQKLVAKQEEARVSKVLTLEKWQEEQAFSGDAGSLGTASHYHKALQDKIEALDNEIEKIKLDISYLQLELQYYYTRLKTFETLTHKAEDELKKEELSKEQKELDDIANTQFLRRQKG